MEQLHWDASCGTPGKQGRGVCFTSCNLGEWKCSCSWGFLGKKLKSFWQSSGWCDSTCSPTRGWCVVGRWGAAICGYLILAAFPSQLSCSLLGTQAGQGPWRGTSAQRGSVSHSGQPPAPTHCTSTFSGAGKTLLEVAQATCPHSFPGYLCSHCAGTKHWFLLALFTSI